MSGVALGDLDAIAVTAGPGLAGALLVGITYAKALAFAAGLPLIAVNHLEGHIHAVLLHEREAASDAEERAVSAETGSGDRPAAEQAAEKGLNSAEIPEKHTSGAKALISSVGLLPGINPRPTTQLGFSAAGEAGTDPGAETRGLKPAPPSDGDSLALVVSGGHTHLYLARAAGGTWRYTLVGRTLDDAAGEAYDKVAKLLGLGYPGGPWIDALARFGDPRAVPFAFSQIKTKLHLAGKAPRTKAARTAPIAKLDRHFLFSFSGIKTAVLRYVELHGLRAEAEARYAGLFGAGDSPKRPASEAEALAICSRATLDLIASFQHAVVGDLLKKTFAAAESLGVGRVLVTGGVAANRELRARFTAEAARRGVEVSFPTLALSTDNAAMIAAAAWPKLRAGEFADLELSANPSLALGG